VLIHITTYLLAMQIKSLEKAFLDEGGLRERMTKARIGNVQLASGLKLVFFVELLNKPHLLNCRFIFDNRLKD